MMKIFVLQLVLLVSLSTLATFVAASPAKGVPCTDSVVEKMCPIETPICCKWPNGAYAACCASNEKCTLIDGTCTEFLNQTAVPGKAVDQGGLNLSISAAAGVMSFGLLFFLGLFLMSAISGYWAYHWRRRRQEERAELLARNGEEESDSDEIDTISNDNKDNQYDDDDDEGDSKLCKVCFHRLADTALLECGHVCCRACAKKMKQTCAFCRVPIKKTVQLDLAVWQREEAEEEERRTTDRAVVVDVDQDRRSK